jgi:alkylhydroperoxidase family enzyme
VPDAVYQEAAAQFDETELAQLIALIATINAWNRIGVATRMSPAAK